MGFIDESFEVEPLPGGIDIGEIADDDVKGAVFLGVDVGKKIGSNKGDAAFEIVIIDFGGLECVARDISTNDCGLRDFQGQSNS